MLQAVLLVLTAALQQPAQEPAPQPAAGGSTEPARAQAALGEQEQAEVRRLIRQLDAAGLADRDAAEQALIALGPSVLASLPQVDERTPAEIKVRLERIVQTLETRLAESVAEPTRVTLSGTMKLQDAFKQVQEQTGNQLQWQLPADKEVTVNEKDEEFWPVLDRLLDLADWSIEPYSGREQMLTFVARPESQAGRFGYACYRGPFRFELTRISAVRDLRVPQVQGLRLHLEIGWEPRLAPISIALPLAELKATDDRGQSLTVENPEATPTVAVQPGISIVEMDLPFELPDRSARQLAKVQGRCEIMLPGRTETFEFPPVTGMQEIPLRKAGVTVVLEGIRKNRDLHELRMRVVFDDAGNALESHRSWVFNNEAYLLDADGNRVDSFTQQTIRQEPNAVGLAYLFDLEKPPQTYRFVYKTPTLILRRSVDFELQGIDLP